MGVAGRIGSNSVLIDSTSFFLMTPQKPLWAMHETFTADKAGVDEHASLKTGKIGDVVIKKKLVESINTLLEPSAPATPISPPARMT